VPRTTGRRNHRGRAARPGRLDLRLLVLSPDCARGKAHRPENLGYAGRRVLDSRRWSGKTRADHRAARKAWLLAMLDLPDPAHDDGQRYR